MTRPKRPVRRTLARTSEARARPQVESAMPIVGIGASAGGLEAIELFLRHTSGLVDVAFVVIQHLDPTHRGAFVELLQRASPLPVVEVTDGMRVVRGKVHVIPPNADLSIVHGVLHLLAPIEPRGLRLPIDFFFRSLATDQGPTSVGVLLSGMGSDGTAGLRAIHENAGATFVQALASAKFDAMPRSAIEAGVADVVAPVEELPDKIANYLRRAPHLARREISMPDGKSGIALEKIVGLLRTATGHDFSQYKTSTILRRIERRMGLHRIADIEHYIRYLREDAKEAQLLFDELLIGVTRFFRDPAAWDRLEKDALPGLLATCTSGVLRAWVPACSTGEEAYSVAIAFTEALAKQKPPRKLTLQLFGTDLDAHAVERARQGFFPRSIAADVSPERLKRFFVAEDQGYRVRKEIRDLAVFAVQNIAQDPPFTRLDLLACRNLLIYFGAEAQRRLLPLFHYSLRPGGILFLGGAETIGAYSDLFAVVDDKSRIYRRSDTGVAARVAVDFPTAFARPYSDASDAPDSEPGARGVATTTLQGVVERLLLDRFTPAAVLAGSKGDVLYVSGRTGKYLELPAGRANWNVLAMARDGLRHALTNALRKAVQTERAVTLAGLRVGTNGGTQIVDVTLLPIEQPEARRGTVLIVFEDVAPPVAGEVSKRARGRQAVDRMDQELKQAREELRTTRDEAQSAQEELKSANEELQSTNEELQSTNEELTTSKEEMQSMNEELQTLNSELHAKVDDLSRASNDMRNLLDSTEIAVLFLDGRLHVRRFTPQAAKIVKLIASDVGRPLADLASDLEYPGLYDDAREVLRTLVFSEKLVGSRSGRRFTVRVMPYRTGDNRIDGLVITLSKHPGDAEASSRARREPP